MIPFAASRVSTVHTSAHRAARIARARLRKGNRACFSQTTTRGGVIVQERGNVKDERVCKIKKL